jgi:hypothetical protein
MALPVPGAGAGILIAVRISSGVRAVVKNPVKKSAALIVLGSGWRDDR